VSSHHQIQHEHIQSDVPARLDRLPWSRWHWLVVIGLGVTWILDGLQVTLQGALGPILQSHGTLGLSPSQIGYCATIYLIGAVCGALVFGYLTDRFGRKKLFYITLSVYLGAALLTACSWNFYSYAAFLCLAGSGIGGEYAAINSAIDELIPARVRGRVDLIVNSTYWVGAMIGAFATVLLLDPHRVPEWLGWRLSFASATVLGLGVLYIRHWIPESPRWLMVHGRKEEAEKVISEVELAIKQSGLTLPEVTEPPITLMVRSVTPWSEIWETFAIKQRQRSFLSFTLMSAQAFFYNAIFFTYALVLAKFYRVPPDQVSWYIIPFAAGNLLGPVLLGHFFDVIGRKQMITATYALSGIMLAATAWLFQHGLLTAQTQSIAWVVIFFIASSAASSAYLTVSELFPLEIRGMAIAIFYSVGTLVGGAAGPAIFGNLIESGSREMLSWGYYAGGALMVFAAIVEMIFGVSAEQKSLESISPPLVSRLTSSAPKP
jgi:MFS family permease